MKDLYELNINRDLNYDGPLSLATVTSRTRKPIPGRFAGRVAVVTGGTSGIGFSVTEELLKEGCRVVFSGRNPETGKEAERKLKEEGLEGFLYVQSDVSKEEDCALLARTAYEKFGRLDHLVNNAFPFSSTSRDLDNKIWYNAFTGGPLAYARMMQQCSKYMIMNGGGSIVNVSSISGHIAQWCNWTYNTMKGVVGMLSKSAAMDFARDNIRVNLMSPAHIWTRVTYGGLTGDTDLPYEYVRGHVRMTGKGYMLNRGGEAVECAAAVLFLLSDDASYITGEEFMVDGGFIAMGSQGALDKGFRDEREYGLEPIYSHWKFGTLNGKPLRDYPELFGEFYDYENEDSRK